LASNIKDNLSRINEQIKQVATKPVKLVAVSKFVEAERLVEAIHCGQKIFGENYVQEAQGKFEHIKSLGLSDFEFHFIGSMQSNKAKDAVGLFSLIHSVDRLKLAEALANKASQKGIHQEILLQINISNEENKSGVLPEKLTELLSEVSKFDSLVVKGLMTIGKEGLSPDERVKEFLEMNKLYNSCNKQVSSLTELSMGMSGDFELAIKHGASIIRVGTAIFGERS
jgi:pyridoxal phosphate enzyme (YggS family)